MGPGQYSHLADRGRPPPPCGSPGRRWRRRWLTAEVAEATLPGLSPSHYPPSPHPGWESSNRTSTFPFTSSYSSKAVVLRNSLRGSHVSLAYPDHLTLTWYPRPLFLL